MRSVLSRSMPAVFVACFLFALSSTHAGQCLGLDGGPGDLDGDGFAGASDCDDSDAGLWGLPGEVSGLRFDGDRHTFAWDAAADLGAAAGRLTYDVFRSQVLVLISSDCFDPVVEVTSSSDDEVPQPGALFAYLVVARNGCGDGTPGPGRGPLACDCASLCDDGDACTVDSCEAGACRHDTRGPRVLRAPSSDAACGGGGARFSTLAEGSGPLSYQWLRNGNPVGTDSPVLVLPAVSDADDGSEIAVEVTDGCATTTSPTATLTVFPDPASCLGGLDGQEAPNGSSRGDVVSHENGHALGLSHESKNVGMVLPDSGEYVRREVDLRIPGRGFDFVWGRTYRSREARGGVLGPQWVPFHDRWVEPEPSVPGALLLHDGTSRVDLYAPAAGGCLTSPGFFRELCPQPDGFTLTFADKHVWTFAPLDGSPAAGRIVEARDRHGNAMQYAYDALGRLQTVTDTLNREIQFGYDAAGRLTSVTDFTGRQVTYDYYGVGDTGGSPGDLRSCTTPAVTGTPTGNDFPQGKTTTYTYSTGEADDRLNHNLLTVTDPAGGAYLENAYASTDAPTDRRFDRVSHQDLPGGRISWTYAGPPPGGPEASLTIVNDRAGNVTEYAYDVSHRLLRGRRYAGRAPDALLPTGLASNRPVNPLRPDDPPFFETQYQYDADYLPTTVVRPNGSQVLRVFDASNTNPRLRANLLQRTLVPGPLGGDQPTIVDTWQYDTDFGTAAWGDPHVTEKEGTRWDFSEKESRPAGGGAGGMVWASAGARTNFDLLEDFDFASRLMEEEGIYYSQHSESDWDFVSRLLENEGMPYYFGFPTQHTDGRSLVHTYGRDPLTGDLLSIQEPLVVTGTPDGSPQTILEQFLYNGFGQIVQHTTPAGRVDTFDYHTAGPEAGYLAAVHVDAPGFDLTTSYSYDAVGNVTSVTDPRGNATDFVVNQRNQLVRTIESAPFSYERDFYYDANDNVVRVDVQNVGEDLLPLPDPYLTTTFEYDALDRLTRSEAEVDQGGVCVVGELEYDANGNRTLRREGEATDGDQPDNVVRRLYDERDLVWLVTRGEGGPSVATDQLDYDADGNLRAHRKGLGAPEGPNVTRYGYDGYDRLTSTIDGEGNEGTYHYDANDNRVSVQVDGEETQGAGLPPIRLSEADNLYDEADRLVEMEIRWFDTASGTPLGGDGGSTTRWFHAPDDRVVRVEDDNGNTTEASHDTCRRVLVITDGKSNTRQYGYDDNSNVVTVTETDRSDLGSPDETFTTTATYDALDRLTSVTDNAGNTRERFYDSRDNRVRGVDRLGNVVHYGYDGLDRLVQVTRELRDGGTGAGPVVGTITEGLEWDDSSRLVSRTDANGNVTGYAYDALDRLAHTTHADGSPEDLIWDIKDSPGQHTDANGTTTTMTYDHLNRLVSRTVARAPGVGGTTSEAFQYDGLSRLRSAQDDDTEATFTYDSLGNVVAETLQIGSGPVRTTTATHDGDGNVLSTAYPSGRIVTRAYDALDRLALAQVSGLTVGGYHWQGSSRVERIDRPAATRTDYQYDDLRRVTRTTQVGLTGPMADHGFGWDAEDNKVSRVNLMPGGESRTFEYDSAYRLAGSVRTVPGNPPLAIDYTLDGMGNRSLVTGGPDAGDYLLDAAQPEPADFQMNQYTATPIGARLHDRNGNTTAIADTSFVYDYANRMVSAADSGGALYEYAYDALGRRVQKLDVASGEATRFYYQGTQVVEEQDETDAALVTNVWGSGTGELLGRYEEQDNDGNGQLDLGAYYPDDMHIVLGVLVDTVLGTGAPVETYDYGDYGQPVFLDPAGAPLPGPVTGNPYLFAGRRWDGETGLYRAGGRYLDPRAGRFTSPPSFADRPDYPTRFPVGVGRAPAGHDLTYGGDNPWSGPEMFGPRSMEDYGDPVGNYGILTASVAPVGPASFEEGSGLDSETEVIEYASRNAGQSATEVMEFSVQPVIDRTEYQEGGSLVPRKRPGRTKYSGVFLTGMAVSKPILDWITESWSTPGPFNPGEWDQAPAPWHHHNIRGPDAPTLEFTAGDPYRAQFELFFATYEAGESARGIAATSAIHLFRRWH